MDSDILAAPQFFVKRLSEGADIVSLIGDRIYDEDIPDVTKTFNPYPCILLSYQGGPDLMTVNARRVMGRPLYLVELVVKDTTISQPAKAAIKQMDELLHQCTNYTHDSIPGFMFHSWRERISKRSSRETAVGTFKYRGGAYRAEVIPTS